MILPTIHRNGTSAQDLFDGYLAAHGAVRDAITALERVEFNARDYYVQDPGNWQKAVAERTSQFERLRAVQDELMALLVHIQKEVQGC